MRAIALLLVAGCGRLSFEPSDASSGTVPDATGSAYANAVLADGPVAYWRFNEPTGSSVQDLTGRGHIGTVMGGVMLGQPSLLTEVTDYSTGFDGATGVVRVADNVDLRFTTGVTLEAWVSAATFANAAAGGYPRIIDKGAGTMTGHTLCVEKLSASPNAYIRLELEGLAPMSLDGTTELVPGQIYHVVGTYDGSFARVYVDGSLDGEQAVTGSLITSTQPLDVGRRPDGQRYWQGFIDEVAVYNRPLTGPEIAAHYTAGR